MSAAATSESSSPSWRSEGATNTNTNSIHNNNNNDNNDSLELAIEFKAEGNAAYQQKNYEKALIAYKKAIEHVLRSGSPQNELAATLWNNRAMTLLKLKQFKQAETSCTHILNNLKQPSWKAYCRRGTARGEMAAQPTFSPPQREQLLQQAQRDFQEAIKSIQKDDRLTPQKKDKESLLIVEEARRILKLNETNPPQRSPMRSPRMTRKADAASTRAVGSSDVTAASPSPPRQSSSSASLTPVTPPASTPPYRRRGRNSGAPPPAVVMNGDGKQATNPAVVSANQQRHNVWQLLLSRQTQLGGDASIPGEAFYILDWGWWTDFCRYVDLFHLQEHANTSNGCNGDPTQSKQAQLILRALPPGAVIPDTEYNHDGEEKERNVFTGPPGPIDNVLLLLHPNRTSDMDETGQQAYYKEWHRTSWSDDPSTSPNGKKPADGGSPIQENGTNNKETETKSVVPLVPNLVRGYDYEIIPREVYHALRVWYGEVTPSICRRSILLEDTSTTVVPLYPQVLNPLPPLLEWDTTPRRRCGTCRRPGVSNWCRPCKALSYCNVDCQRKHWSYHKPYCRKVAAADDDTPTAIEQSEGRVGLLSLGNTCFMNAALQCLSHTAPLTRHFLSGRYTTDLNRTNPLGTGGKLAEAYAEVLQELWMNPGITYAKPYALKRAIAMFAPRFAGTLQHDSQEFLAYLLDGLHEDLNRIRQAPYVEMPDFQDGQNMFVAGARTWEAHMRRNQSFVLNTFYGQFKSTCVCPRCNRVSVSFDAFNHVSLEIPQNQPIVPIAVTVVRTATKAGAAVPERFALRFRKSNPLVDYRHELSKLCGIPVDNLHLCRVKGSEIVHVFGDDETAVTIRPMDSLFAYEANALNDPCIHAWVRHKAQTPTGEVAFGHPLFTSFPVNFSCRQVWEHFRRHCVDKVADPNDLDCLLRVIFYDDRSRPWEVFPIDVVDSDEEEDPAVPTRTAVLPKDLDEPLFRFLGQRALKDYLDIVLEWSHVEDFSGADSDKESDAPVVHADRFSTVRDHSSYIDALPELQKEATTTRKVTLDDCFQAFIKPERLDERNMWYCSKCKEHVRAMKTMELWRLPDVLVVHLKRFEFRNVLRREKLETFVDYPVEGLDMSEHCGSHQDSGFVHEHIPAVYDLFGVVQHFGRAGFGHYTAFGREWNELGEMGEWSLFDDTHVTPVDGNRVVSQAAYVLFYRRRPAGRLVA